MRKPWSISTTVRNAGRIRNFLIALKMLEDQPWNNENQIKYQILLIQYKFYGLTAQFLNGLSREHVELLNKPEPLTFEEAEEIFYSKNYVDPAMRGRQSLNPIKKLGLAKIENGRVKITPLGDYLLKEDYDLGEMFFRSFLKWQLPNPTSDDFRTEDGFAIKPFVGTLHLIDSVNRKCEALDEEPKGISKDEFATFVPTLISHEQISEQTQRIIDLRLACKGKSQDEQMQEINNFKWVFVKEFLATDSDAEIQRTLSNLKEYGDNIIRYFRLTRYLHIRGGGFYVDLEPRRHIEIAKLLEADNAAPIDFSDVDEYLSYISDITKPVLPWETEEELKRISRAMVEDVQSYLADLASKHVTVPSFSFENIDTLTIGELKAYVERLRDHRRELQEAEIRYDSQDTAIIEGCIEELRNIHGAGVKQSVELERLTTLALNALNDALQISPNYPVDDDNEPTFTAPAGKPDIECFYERFNAVCEVTMLTARSQWYNEGQPVMRHVRDFENQYDDKEAYCLFLALRLHQDTIETFWFSVKYGYQGAKQRIVPLTITQFIGLLEVLLEIKNQGKTFSHDDLLRLYDDIIGVTDGVNDSNLWVKETHNVLQTWKDNILSD